MKILVAIASYGVANDRYLHKAVREYQAMEGIVDIVVLCEKSKPVPFGTRLLVGLPTRDPWSLPFAHKRLFADHVDEYDLFIYAEDDILITHDNVQAFLEASSILPEDEIAGFFLIELGPDGRLYYPEVNKHFHWDPQSVRARGRHLFARFSCEHAGCYILTRVQLKRAIASGGFAVGPHQGKYDLACTASTDPYTQCGAKKMVCISELDRFYVRHLSNKYIGTDFDLEDVEFQKLVRALHEIAAGKRAPWQLLDEPETLTRLRWAENYYERTRSELADLVPLSATTMLSIGCGWGDLEGKMVERGVRVTAIPLDSVIAACAEARGITTVYGGVEDIHERMGSKRFDCILISNVLHLMRDPLGVLRACTEALSNEGRIVFSAPNFDYLKAIWRGLAGRAGYTKLRSYDDARLHRTGPRVIRHWLANCDLLPEKVLHVFPKRAELPAKLAPGLVSPFLAKELIIRARKKQEAYCPTAASMNPDVRLAEESQVFVQ
jgi:2-polyprenyl-3-methyl-5-hydroxy-6-metoxy-1,4-benzoquinol methylase